MTPDEQRNIEFDSIIGCGFVVMVTGLLGGIGLLVYVIAHNWKGALAFVAAVFVVGLVVRIVMRDPPKKGESVSELVSDTFAHGLIGFLVVVLGIGALIAVVCYYAELSRMFP